MTEIIFWYKVSWSLCPHGLMLFLFFYSLAKGLIQSLKKYLPIIRAVPGALPQQQAEPRASSPPPSTQGLPSCIWPTPLSLGKRQASSRDAHRPVPPLVETPQRDPHSAVGREGLRLWPECVVVGLLPPDPAPWCPLTPDSPPASCLPLQRRRHGSPHGTPWGRELSPPLCR